MAFPSKSRATFARWDESDVFERICRLQPALITRRIPHVDGAARGVIDPRERAKRNLTVIQQAQLHRAERLITSSVTLLLDNNVYGVALVARGLIESAGIVGFFCGKLESLANRGIMFDEIQKSIYLAMAGAKHEFFKDAESPVNVLTCIAKADEYLGRHFFEKESDMLNESYRWLSEYAHPNFLSMQSAFTTDASGRFQFRHRGGLRKIDFQVLHYVALTGDIFVHLFDELGKRISDGTIDQVGETNWGKPA